MSKKWFEQIAMYKITVFLPTAVAAVIAHWVFLVNGYGCPDTLAEGITVYQSASWSLSLGRWAIPFVNALSLNLLMPVLNVLVSMLCCSMTAIFLAELLRIQNKVFLALTGISLVAAPAVVCQQLYPEVNIGYSMALLFSTTAAWLVLTGEGALRFWGAVLALAFALGNYQAYVGFAACVILMTLLFRLVRGEAAARIVCTGCRALLMGALGGLLYFVILMAMQKWYGVSMATYSGADQIGVRNTIANLGYALKAIYQNFIKYCTDGTANRNLGFVPLCVVLVLVACLAVLHLLRGRKYAECALFVLLLPLLPVSMNLVTIITPQQIPHILMSHQMQLVVPLTFALADNGRQFLRRLWKPTRWLCGALSVMVCWSCILAAYATHGSMKYMHEYMRYYTTPILQAMQADTDYQPGMRALMAGLPHEIEIQQNYNPLFPYSYQFYAVLWYGEYGVLTSWPQYIRYYFAKDIGYISEAEYYAILDSEEFASMPCWPQEGCMQKIGDVFVVKIEEDPPRS